MHLHAHAPLQYFDEMLIMSRNKTVQICHGIRICECQCIVFIYSCTHLDACVLLARCHKRLIFVLSWCVSAHCRRASIRSTLIFLGTSIIHSLWCALHQHYLCADIACHYCQARTNLQQLWREFPHFPILGPLCQNLPNLPISNGWTHVDSNSVCSLTCVPFSNSG